MGIMEKIIPESIGIKQPTDYSLLLLKDILTPLEVKELFQVAMLTIEENRESIASKEYFTRPDGSLAENAPLFPKGINERILHEYRLRIRKRLNTPFVNEIFTPLVGRNGKKCIWGITMTLSSGKNLDPHTDDLEKAAEDAKVFTHDVTSGIYKGLVFLGRPNLDYTNYGTCFFEPWIEGVDEGIPHKWCHQVKLKHGFEIPFIPGNGFLFGTNSESYHGTDYRGTAINNRVTLTLEYHEQE